MCENKQNPATENQNETNLLYQRLARLDGLLRRYYGHHGHHGGGDAVRGQGRVLALLRRTPELSQRELGYLLDMRKQSLAELLAKLEAKGFITRTPAEDDKRVLVVRLTPEGEKAAEQVHAEASGRKDVFSALSEEEQKQLLASIEKLITALEAELPQGEGPRHEGMGGHGPHHGPHGGPHGGCPHGRGGQGRGHFSEQGNWPGGPHRRG